MYFKILSIIWQLLLSVKWRHMFSYEVKTGPIYGMETEYKIRKWLVLKCHGSGHLQIILHLNKITEWLKMTTFKIVFTFDVFFSVETTCTARWHVFYIRNRHISVSSFVYKYDQWPHDRKSRCPRGRRHSSILYSPSGFFSSYFINEVNF